jgi:hypothetical protein
VTDPTPPQRPRPAYGEYATAEEQAARIRRPEVTAALETGQSPDAVAAAAPPAQAPSPAAPPRPTLAQSTAKSPTAAMSRPRFVDRVITFALLGYGLFTVVQQIPAAADYPQFAATFLGVFGVDEALSDPAGARAWGLAAALTLGVGWLVTFGFAWVNLRAARISFWIPLVGGIVINMVASVLLVAPLMMDAPVWQALQDGMVGFLG